MKYIQMDYNNAKIPTPKMQDRNLEYGVCMLDKYIKADFLMCLLLQDIKNNWASHQN